MKGINYVTDWIINSFSCCWSDSLVDQQLHPNAVNHEENFECSCGYRRNTMDTESIWNHR